jgi:hypothetical protein
MKANSIEIEVLILNRTAALKLTRSDLVRRAGFKNVAKGIRLLDELCSGDSKATRAPIAGLPAALELASEVIADASDKESNKSPKRLLRSPWGN